MPHKYPEEFRRDVVAVARRGEASMEETARDFGISPNSLKRWLAQADIDDGVSEGTTSGEQRELRELRTANRRLQQENEILRRAAAYFAKDSLPK